MYNEQQKEKNSKMEEWSEQNEYLKRENVRILANIDALREEMSALQNELYGNDKNKEVIDNDKVLHKLQDVLQVLYSELKPEKDNLDDPKEIMNAFKAWKKRERIKYQNLHNNSHMELSPAEIDVASTSCHQSTAWLSFFSFFKDF